jgi:hypothetical protein
MAEAGIVQGEAKTPSDFLKSIRGKPVIVKLNSGVDYRGRLHTTATRHAATAALSLSAGCVLCLGAVE